MAMEQKKASDVVVPIRLAEEEIRMLGLQVSILSLRCFAPLPSYLGIPLGLFTFLPDG